MYKLYSPIIAHCSQNPEKMSEVSSIPPNYKLALMNDTPGDRVRRMFTTNEFGISPEIRYILQTGSSMAVIAGFAGALKGMKTAKEDFHRRNVASVYESAHQARRSLTDSMTLAAVKEGFKNAFKYSSFCTVYLLGTMTVANYRNKITVWEHLGCGALLGGFARLNYGVKGFLVAGGLGGFLGFLAGGIITLTVRAFGVTLEEMRYYQHEDHYARILRERKKAELKAEEERKKAEEERRKEEIV